MDERYENSVTRSQVGFSNRVNLNTSPMSDGGQEPVLNMTVTLHGEVVH